MSVSTSSKDWPTSALSAAATAFAALTCDPEPLSLDCGTLTGNSGDEADLGLPSGVVPLPQLRDWLLAHPDQHAARDAVWRELVRRARRSGPQWVIAAAGMAMPALVAHAHALTARFCGDRDDMDAEVLSGFLQALRDHVDVTKPGICASLCFAAYRAGHDLIVVQAADVPVDDLQPFVAESRTPRLPFGHPDLLVEHAAALGLIDTEDVQPWIDVRLGHRALPPIADCLGITVDALRMRLKRTDIRLADALRTGVLTGVISASSSAAPTASARKGAGIRAGKATRRRAGTTRSAPVAMAA